MEVQTFGLHPPLGEETVISLRCIRRLRYRSVCLWTLSRWPRSRRPPSAQLLGSEHHPFRRRLWSPRSEPGFRQPPLQTPPSRASRVAARSWLDPHGPTASRPPSTPLGPRLPPRFRKDTWCARWAATYSCEPHPHLLGRAVET